MLGFECGTAGGTRRTGDPAGTPTHGRAAGRRLHPGAAAGPRRRAAPPVGRTVAGGRGRHRTSGPAPTLFGAVPDTVVADGVAHTHPARLLEALRPHGTPTGWCGSWTTASPTSPWRLAAADPAGATATATWPTLEQSIVDGHPLHPCCRTRIGMSTADALAVCAGAPPTRPAAHRRGRPLPVADDRRAPATAAARPPVAAGAGPRHRPRPRHLPRPARPGRSCHCGPSPRSTPPTSTSRPPSRSR